MENSVGSDLVPGQRLKQQRGVIAGQSYATELQLIVLVAEKSNLAPRAGAVICRAVGGGVSQRQEQQDRQW
jgi:hypothetical protein